MRTNKLIYTFLLAATLGFSSQSFAIPVSMDGVGTVTSVSGSISGVNVGDAFSSMTVLDPDTAVDLDGLAGVGRYAWHGDIFETTASVGLGAFNTQSTKVRILNDYNGYIDQYRIDSWGTYNGDRLLFNIILQDNSGTVFNSDDFVLEPSLNGFDDFSRAYFMIRSYDDNNNLNFTIRGDLTSFVDPVLANVPEPNTVFLLGLGLIAVFFTSRKGKQPEAQLAV